MWLRAVRDVLVACAVCVTCARARVCELVCVIFVAKCSCAGDVVSVCACDTVSPPGWCARVSWCVRVT